MPTWLFWCLGCIIQHSFCQTGYCSGNALDLYSGVRGSTARTLANLTDFSWFCSYRVMPGHYLVWAMTASFHIPPHSFTSNTVTLRYVIQNVLFIVSPSTVPLSHRKPASAGTSHDSCRAPGNDCRHSVLTTESVGNKPRINKPQVQLIFDSPAPSEGTLIYLSMSHPCYRSHHHLPLTILLESDGYEYSK